MTNQSKMLTLGEMVEGVGGSWVIWEFFVLWAQLFYKLKTAIKIKFTDERESKREHMQE